MIISCHDEHEKETRKGKSKILQLLNLKFLQIWVKVYCQVKWQTCMALDACSILCCLLLNLESLSVKSLQTRVIPLLSCMDSALARGNRQPGWTSQVCLKCWNGSWNTVFLFTPFSSISQHNSTFQPPFPLHLALASFLFPCSPQMLAALGAAALGPRCCWINRG